MRTQFLLLPIYYPHTLTSHTNSDLDGIEERKASFFDKNFNLRTTIMANNDQFHNLDKI